MGMDIYGKNGNYFRANIWSWGAITHSMDLAGIDVPASWHCNQGAGLASQSKCDNLANKLNTFLTSWDGNVLIRESTSLKVDKSGRFVSPDTPGSKSPYQVRREHLQDFVNFLQDCQGFEIW